MPAERYAASKAAAREKDAEIERLNRRITNRQAIIDRVHRAMQAEIIKFVFECKFCARDMRVTVASYLENPYCKDCYADRLQAAEQGGSFEETGFAKFAALAGGER